jgi:Icc-related predicted phosphoesterase
MSEWFFVSDLHGHVDRYEKLFDAIGNEGPAAVLLGGDLFPSGFGAAASLEIPHDDFVMDFLAPRLEALRDRLGTAYPRVLLIFGNDDRRCEEPAVRGAADAGLWEYIPGTRTSCNGHEVYGYPFVPPTPFLLKDWEKYDVSRYVDPGCVSPEEGLRSVAVPEHEVRHQTIQQDLDELVSERPVDRAVFLFHSPPYRTNLDRAALDGRMIDHVPVDVHVGSVAIKRFIEQRQPLVTLHGHIHESARLMGEWRERIGRTWCLSAAHDGPELALVRFDPADPGAATRRLV